MTSVNVSGSTVIELATEGSQSIAISTADIDGMGLSDTGALTILLKDGSSYTISNFHALAENDTQLLTSDGGIIETKALFENLAGSPPAQTIAQPASGTSAVYEIQPGTKYNVDFQTATDEEVLQSDGALLIVFADGGQLTLKNFAAAMDAENPAEINVDGEYMTLREFLDALKLAEAMAEQMQAPREAVQADLPSVQQTTDAQDQRADELDAQMAQLAAQLSEIEPAAGGNAAQGARGGFGFQSSFTATPIIPLQDIGPIGPTELQFRLPEFEERLFFVQESSAVVPPGNPTIQLNNGITNALVKEDGTVNVPVTATLNANAAPGEFLTVTITGFDPAWGIVTAPVGSFNAAGTEWTITLPAGQNLSTVFTMSPAPNSDIDLTGLVGTVVATDPSTGLSASAQDDFNVIVDAVADKPLIDADSETALEGESIALNIVGQLTDTDGSEIITHYEISGVPAGFSFNAGTDLGGGVWSFDPAEMTGLEMTGPADYFGTLNLTATVFNTENPVSDGEFDYSDNDNSASANFSLTWKPVVEDPEILVNGGIDDVWVKEDSTVDVTLVANLGPNGSGNEVLTVTVTGFDPSWGTYSAPVGSFNGAGTEWTIIMPAGQNLSTVFTFTPNPDSDVDMPNLTATAQAYEPASDTYATAVDEFNVLVDAVADTPDLDVSDVGLLELATAPLQISTAVTDTDGSEEIVKIEISGLPTGAYLNNGTESGGVWTLSLADLTGLTITVPNHSEGTYTLTVKSYAEEVNLSGEELDYSDNIAVATETLTLTITDGDQPIIEPAVVTVEEAALTGGNVVINDQITADFGADGPGSFSANDGFFSSATLTSGGVPVTVVLAGDTYIGTAGGETIFTLQIGTDGAYSFTLYGTLDHPDASDPNDNIALEFGVTATDIDGDQTNGVITINIRDDAPVAEDDFGTLGATDTSTSGNLLDNDYLSQDGPNLVTQVSFGGTVVDVPETGTVTIAGAYGVLEVAADGSYTYVRTSTGPTSSPVTTALDPVSGDVAGTQTSFTKNGITISIGQPQPGSSVSAGGDLKWKDSGVEGAGIGIGDNGSGDHKVWPQGETLVVDPAEDASLIKLTLADIGPNNMGNPLSVKIYFTDGTETTVKFNVPNPAPAGGLWDIEINSADFGGKQIDKLDLFNKPGDGSVSFMLNNVESTSYVPDGCDNQDQFTYVLTDDDGDQSSAVLTVDVACLVVTDFINPDALSADETKLANGNDVVSGTVSATFGTGDGVFAANGGFSFGGSAAGGNLTSGGVPVIVALVGDTYVGSAGSEEIFTLSLDSDGSFTFTLIGTLDHADPNDPSDIITLQFGATATDDQGLSSADGVITVNVLDDGVTAHDDFATFNKADGGAAGNVLDNDELSQDGPNMVTKIAFGGTAYDVPETGTVTVEGDFGTLMIAADGSYNYTLHATSGGGISTDIDHDFTEMLDFPALTEGQAIGGATLNNRGINPGDLTVAHGGTGTVTFVSEGAGYDNTLGMYTIAADGTLQAASIMVVNGNAATPGESYDFTANAGETLGFFIVADGARVNNSYAGIDFDNGTLNFVYKYGSADERPANISDNGADIALVYTADGGSQTVIQGPVYHTSERGSSDNLNADGTVRVVSGLPDSGNSNVLRIGFEDLPNLGDKDYEDIVFDVSYTGTVLTDDCACGTDVFTYTLTDSDGDNSQANLTLECFAENDIPVLVKIEKLSVDESDLAPTTSASGVVTADFGADGPGSFTGNGSTNLFGLTSGGVAVDVSYAGGVYTGTAGGQLVFTLEIAANGTYEFTLHSAVDHADPNDPNDSLMVEFGVRASDQDGDYTDGVIKVKIYDDGPVAEDDYNLFSKDGDATGNVLDNDSLSQDGPNLVTKIAFGGTEYDVPETGTVTIDGDFGMLAIAADGSYNYTLFATSGGTAAGDSFSMNPVSSDITFGLTSLTKNGITVSVGDPVFSSLTKGTLSWVNTSDGNGIGIKGNSSNKVWNPGEVLEVRFDQAADTVTAFIADIGSNNLNSGIDFKVYVDGVASAISYEFAIGTTTPVGGVVEITLDAATLGLADGALITGFDVFSIKDSSLSAASFLLNNVVITTPGEDIDCACGTDVFTYTLTDGDGDNSQANLTLECFAENDVPVLVKIEKLSVDESDLAPTTSASGVVTADFGADGPGSFTGNGSANLFGLTSGGVAVDVAYAGGVYTGTAGGTLVFTLEIAANGTYEFTLHSAVDHADPNDPNDSLMVEFGVRASDQDGDFTDGVIKVKIYDDGPVAEDDLQLFDKNAGGAAGNVLDNDSLSQDGPNLVTKVAFDGTEYDVPETGTVSIDGDFGTLAIAADGTYNYTLFTAPGSAGPTDPVLISTLYDGNNNVTVEVYARENGNDVIFDIKLTTGTADMIGFYLDIDGDGGPVVSLGGGNNMQGTAGFDYGYIIGTVGGNDPDTVEASVTVSGLSMADLEGAKIGIRATSVGDCREDSLKLIEDVTIPPQTPCPCDNVKEQFTYTLTDGDGDSSTAVLTIECANPVLIVGENSDDVDGSTVSYRVGDGSGVITGGMAGDILIGDAGGSFLKPQNQDYNIVLILDVSGSMKGGRMTLLKNSVNNLLSEFKDYEGGTVKVHIVPFSTDAHTAGTFTVTDQSGYNSATGFVNGLSAGGWTNYEAALQSAVSWLEGSQPLNGDAETYTYFVSDGEPNRYLNNSGNVRGSGDSAAARQRAMDEITGVADGTNEVAQLQALSTQVIGVGLAIDAAGMARLDVIDSNDAAQSVSNPNDLSAALQGASPLNQLDDVGGDVIEGGAGNNIIFGDAVNTDILATAHDLGTAAGAGWEVFERLEAGYSALTPGWSRADTIEYIRNNYEELGAETVTASGGTRKGGNDILRGGDGDDIIFGQEGDDTIIGGAGNNILYGGSGADTFLYEAITHGVDTIKDFNVAEGDRIDLSQLLQDSYDPLQDSINDFVYASDNGASTTIVVDVTGAGNFTNAAELAVLEGVSGFDLADLLNSASFGA